LRRCLFFNLLGIRPHLRCCIGFPRENDFCLGEIWFCRPRPYHLATPPNQASRLDSLVLYHFKRKQGVQVLSGWGQSQWQAKALFFEDRVEQKRERGPGTVRSGISARFGSALFFPDEKQELTYIELAPEFGGDSALQEEFFQR
jgi:hypothetical protein